MKFINARFELKPVQAGYFIEVVQVSGTEYVPGLDRPQEGLVFGDYGVCAGDKIALRVGGEFLGPFLVYRSMSDFRGIVHEIKAAGKLRFIDKDAQRLEEQIAETEGKLSRLKEELKRILG